MFGLLESAVPPLLAVIHWTEDYYLFGVLLFTAAALRTFTGTVSSSAGVSLIFRCSQKNFATESTLYMLEYNGCGGSIFRGS
jgi:hypothetical protein